MNASRLTTWFSSSCSWAKIMIGYSSLHDSVGLNALGGYDCVACRMTETNLEGSGHSTPSPNFRNWCRSSWLLWQPRNTRNPDFIAKYKWPQNSILFPRYRIQASTRLFWVMCVPDFALISLCHHKDASVHFAEKSSCLETQPCVSIAFLKKNRRGKRWYLQCGENLLLTCAS